ncbi:hypothetical protein ABZ615_10700 [Streptomyces sp. NPDC007325]|uniref:hypothetical protein n=1 Tax=Streptomyces sp. NPDC007325 TaxID=3154588 RepID=UPI0033D5C2C9
MTTMTHWQVTFGTTMPDGSRGTHTFIVAASCELQARTTADDLAESAEATHHRRGAHLDARGDVAIAPWIGDPVLSWAETWEVPDSRAAIPAQRNRRHQSGVL